ncbi:hypothetical protein E8E11_001719 [Didymella keratinophila]|nr:hypothetical protein E8E11_001719 [Didymella keratinophila]
MPSAQNLNSHHYCVRGPCGNIGIGFDTVAALTASSADYHVIIGSRSLDKGNAALSKIKSLNNPGNTPLIQLDVTSDSFISSTFTSISHSFGRLDILVNNAGICPEPSSAKWPTRDELKRIFDTNVFGPTLATRAAITLLQYIKDSHIINITTKYLLLSSGLSRMDSRLNKFRCQPTTTERITNAPRSIKM